MAIEFLNGINIPAGEINLKGFTIERASGSGETGFDIDALGSYILSPTDGNFGPGARPAGSHNGVAILSFQTHVDNYYTQLALSTNTNDLFIRSANSTTTFGSYSRLWNDSHFNATQVIQWGTAYTHSQATHAPTNAEANVQANWTATSGDAYILNKPTTFAPSAHNHDDRYYTETESNAKYLLNTSDSLSGNLTVTGNLTVDGSSVGLYHKSVEDKVYFDDYNGSKFLHAVFNKNQRADIIRYQPVDNLEYWDGSSWQDGSSQMPYLKNLLDGRQDTSWYLPSTYYKIRFTATASTSYPLRAHIGLQMSWTGSSFPGCSMQVEEKQTDDSWLEKVDAQFTSTNGVTNWGTMFRADSALHTGRGATGQGTRITIDFYGWTPSNSSYATVPLQNIFIFSNFSGAENTDYTNLIDYNKNLTVAGNIVLGTGKTVDGVDISALPTSFAPTNAEQNVQANWTATTGDAHILNKPTIPTDFVSAASGGTFGGGISVEGNILLTGDPTTTNQSRMIDFTGFDKEGTTDPSDRAFIRHTVGVGGHAGSTLEISSQNDVGDGIAFTTHSSSLLRHNGNAIFSTGHKPQFSEIENTPTTLSGYGITDGLAIGTSATTALAGNTALLAIGTTATTAMAGNTSIPTVPSSYAPTNAEQNVQANWTATSGDAYIQNKPTTFAPSAHNHTSLTGITSLAFAAEGSDSASITTTINSNGTYFDFNLTDDNNNDWWRWRFTPSGSTVYDAMVLKPVSNGNANLIVSGNVTADNIPASYAPTNAEANVQANWTATSGDALILNKPTIPTDFVSAANGGTFGGDISAPSFIGKLMGGATGAPDATIWCVSGDYTNWGIFYDENTPDVIQFKSGGTTTASIALDNGNINTSGTLTASGYNNSNWNTAYGWGNHASEGYLTRITPNAPTSLTTTIVNSTINVGFTASSTANIDNYLVFNSVDGGDYGLISVIPPADFGATMSIIDDTFSATGSQAYRVYAVKQGVYSAVLAGSQAYAVTSAEPTNMSVVNLNTAYYAQWDPPSSNARFVTAYNVYKHEHATQASLLRSSATLVYSGMNMSYMYGISGGNNTNYHQFWVETTIG